MENYQQFLSIALKAAVLAGREIKDVYAREFSVELKDDKSPLTEADKRSHEKIAQVLQASGLPLLSEEGKTIPFEERNQWDLFWLVDPLDGTKEFIKRNGEFTVNIALIKNGRSVLGVIYAPVIDTLYFGCEGCGAYKTEADIDYLSHLIQSEHVTDRLIAAGHRLPIRDENRPFTVVASRSHMSEETAGFIEELRKKHGNLQMISKGSSLKLCLVAEGAADVYPRFAPTMEWDTAAGQAIANSAGFSVVNARDRSAVIYNKSELLNPWFIVQ
ncbi:MAG: 3'(2'),5'-bisphosphate nucleotidase CysQ [Bacteroidia bacterium]|nr:3'(2'),5'-bisphosphate nucleotidase CysQ [Bacteroidia bacterium]